MSGEIIQSLASQIDRLAGGLDQELNWRFGPLTKLDRLSKECFASPDTTTSLALERAEGVLRGLADDVAAKRKRLNENAETIRVAAE